MTRLLGVLSWLCVLAACSASKPMPDAGDGGADVPPPDAGPPDSSSPDGDGGSQTCDEIAHDAVLGTAQVGTGYRVVDSAVLPVTSWLPIAVDPV